MKDSDDLRAHLGSLIAPHDSLPHNDYAETEKNRDDTQAYDENTEADSTAEPHDDVPVDSEEEKERLEEWLDSSERAQQQDSDEGFEFVEAETDVERDLWPAFEDTRTSTDAAHTDVAATNSDDEENEPVSVMRRMATAAVTLSVVVITLTAFLFSGFTYRTVSVPQANIPEATQELSCLGPFNRSIDVGVNVTNADEEISDRAFIASDAKAAFAKKAVPVVDGASFQVIPKATGVLRALDSSSLVAGANVHRAQRGDMRGSATAPCMAAAMEHYFVGSQTDVGTSNELLVYNPNSMPTALSLEAFGGQGSLSVGSLKQFSIAPQTLRRVSLDGLVDVDSRVSFHLVSSSGPVSAVIQETVLKGASPAGISYIMPTNFTTQHVVPGVLAENEESLPVLRVANMNAEQATFHVRAISAEGVVSGDKLAGITVEPNTVLDIALSELELGVGYTVIVEADMRVSVGVQNVYAHADSQVREIAWLSAQNQWRHSMVMFGDSSAHAYFYADEAATVTVTPIDASGKKMKMLTAKVAAGRVAVLDFPAGAVGAVLESDVFVYGGVGMEVSLADNAVGIDWIPVTPSLSDSAAQRVGLF